MNSGKLIKSTGVNAPRESAGTDDVDSVPKSDRERVTLHVPADVAEYIKVNGGSGFVVGLVRSVMR